MRRGVSEIVASLILILIVSLLGTAVYSYTVQLNQSQEDSLLRNLAISTGRAQERFRVASAWWSGSGSTVRLTILNYGLNEVAMSDVYVNGQKASTWVSGRLTPILLNKIQNINFNSPIAITAGNAYQLTIVSQRGTTVAYTWIP